MPNPKIELKKIHISERLSEETTAFVADLYINGKKAGEAKNDGHGGATFYQAYDAQGRELVAEAEAYCKTLPPKRYPASDGMRAFEVIMDLENFIDNLIEEELKKKELKKFTKKFANHIIWGIPDGDVFNQVKFKRNFLPRDREQLQKYIDEQVKPKLKEGEQILNTNLQALGIVV